MAISRWRPTGELAGLHSALDRLFGDMFGDTLSPAMGSSGAQEEGSGTGQAEMATFHLPVDIMETENGYRIEAPVPGIRPEDVEVTFADGILTIDAKRTDEQQRREGRYLRREVAFGRYRRQIALPGDVQADGIRAMFNHGLLTVEVPRAPKPEPKRIQVQASQTGAQEAQVSRPDSEGSRQEAPASAQGAQSAGQQSQNR